MFSDMTHDVKYVISHFILWIPTRKCRLPKTGRSWVIVSVLPRSLYALSICIRQDRIKAQQKIRNKKRRVKVQRHRNRRRFGMSILVRRSS